MAYSDIKLGAVPTVESENNLTEHRVLLSTTIRNSLTRLDMLIYLGKKEEAQDEIQSLAEFLESHGI